MTVSVDNKEVKTGDKVTVTIHSTQKTEGANFIVEWNHSFLKYESSTATARNLDEGRFEFVNADGLNDFQIVFTVVGTKGNDTIKVTPVQITNGTNDNFDVVKKSDSVKVEIKEEPKPDVDTNTVTPSNTTTPPTNTTAPTNTTKPTNTTTTTTTTNTTTPPSKMPQTGYNITPLLAIGAIVVVAAIIVIRKRK